VLSPHQNSTEVISPCTDGYSDYSTSRRHIRYLWSKRKHIVTLSLTLSTTYYYIWSLELGLTIFTIEWLLNQYIVARIVHMRDALGVLSLVILANHLLTSRSDILPVRLEVDIMYGIVGLER
jgi:hypothetical protein